MTGKQDEWLTLAKGDSKLLNGMERLYDVFRQAPHLGSLIDVRIEKGNMFEAGYSEIQTLVKKALSKKSDDAELAITGVVAQDMARVRNCFWVTTY